MSAVPATTSPGADASSAATSQAAAAAGPEPSGGVLVVDDSPDALTLVTDLLSRAGYRVRAAPSGRLALRSAARQVPELVLLDVQMPDLDGFEVCRLLRADPRTADVPIVFLSALTDTDSRVRGLDAGAIDFISKPFQAEEVLARVRTHLLLGRSLRALDHMCRDLQQESLVRSTDLAEVTGQLADQVRAHRDTARRLRLAHHAIETTVDGIVIIDGEGVIESANPAAHDLTRRPHGDLVGRPATCLVPDPGTVRRIARVLADPDGPRTWSGEAWLTTVDGDAVPAWARVSSLDDPDGRRGHVLAVMTDISQRKAAEERIAYLAQHDPHTGLPRRVLLRDRFETARVAEGGRPQGVLVIDIDAFRSVNDSLGHAIGDEYLRRVAAVLTATLGERASICRLGADAFAALVGDVGSPADASRVAERLLRAVDAQLTIDGHPLRRTASIGIALYPDDADAFDDLVRRADTAMGAAKQAGRNCAAFHTEPMARAARERLRLEDELRDAIAGGGLAVRYQPQVELATGRIVGLEALARWPRPDGDIGPAAFIPLAEATGQIIELGVALRRSVFTQVRRWWDAGIAVPVAVNISPVEIRHGGLEGSILDALAEVGLPGSLIHVELVESSLVDDSDRTRSMFDRLRAGGIRIDIDDFLTGYSNFAYLRRFQIAHLKIDRSFVAALSPGSEDQAIVSAAIRMAIALDIPTIAEGVETADQRDLLLTAGCRLDQGFLYDRPLTAADATDRLHRLALPWSHRPDPDRPEPDRPEQGAPR